MLKSDLETLAYKIQVVLRMELSFVVRSLIICVLKKKLKSLKTRFVFSRFLFYFHFLSANSDTYGEIVPSIKLLCSRGLVNFVQ